MQKLLIRNPFSLARGEETDEFMDAEVNKESLCGHELRRVPCCTFLNARLDVKFA